MKRLVVAIIHGIASEDKHYSTEFKHRVVEHYLKGDRKNRMEDDLLFHEIYWGDLIQGVNEELLQRLDYRNELTYTSVRQLFVDFMNLALAYNNSSDSGLYQAIHNRIADSMKKLSAHRHVDADNTPVVLLAHSFGSVIMSHYIQDLRNAGAGNEKVSNMTCVERFETLAGLITFGSPLAIYDSLTERLPAPIEKTGHKLDPELKARAKWLNFYDKDDIVAYPMKSISDDYEKVVSADHEINVGSAATSWNPACHTGYWEDKDFYRPVANYLGEMRASHPFWELPDTL
ncbi:hypothetical protein [Kangiella shandongensis]|uniref:hypothetical protein n=1 Tax=Kangiella shandongensis TaxID=2763258 RepID=UPI001CBEB4D7|nr:hypothetical protein [Kangiella shandongensis]